MTSPNRVARAYVEITADYDKFAREAGTKINAALKQAGNNIDFDPLKGRGEAAGTTFAKGVQEGISNEFRIGSARLASSIAQAAESNDSRNRVTRAFRSLASTAASAFGAFFGSESGGFLSNFGGQLASGLSFLGEAFTKVGKGFGNFLMQAGIGLIVFSHLISVIFVLTANLTGLAALLALLPGTIAVLIGAIIPLVIVFQNFGGALAAIAEGDPEKIAEALGKLSPAARSVAKEFQALMPFFRELQRMTQQAFFQVLEGQLTSLFNILGKENIAQGLVNVSDALARFLSLLFRVAESPAFLRLSETLFGNAQDRGAIARIFDEMGPSVERLLIAFAEVANATMPTLEGVFRTMADGIREFAEWLEAAAQDGRLQQWLDKGLQTAGDLKDLLGAILDLLGTIFKNTDDGGERFLQKVTKAIEKLTAFFESEEGKRALEAMVSLAGAFADALSAAADAAIYLLKILGAINNALNNAQAHKDVFQSTSRFLLFPGFAEGGIVSKPTFAMVGEAGPEAVVPLNDPTRAREVMSQAGLVPLAESMMGGGNMTVHVYLGTDEITDILDTRVQRGLAGAARSLSRRPKVA